MDGGGGRPGGTRPPEINHKITINEKQTKQSRGNIEIRENEFYGWK